MTRIAPGIVLDEALLEEQFVRSPGPGGQNVNKVASAVQLRYDAARAGLPENVRNRLCRLAGSLMARDGSILIQASRFRSQARNREDARARLLELLREAWRTPKSRVPTRPSRAARERRMQDKQQRSRLKKLRSDRGAA